MCCWGPAAAGHEPGPLRLLQDGRVHHRGPGKPRAQAVGRSHTMIIDIPTIGEHIYLLLSEHCIARFTKPSDA